MIEAGTMLQNRYRVEQKIGQGGMGAVYIATDERFGSKVAIKETLFTQEKLGKAFEREARLLNSLKHPALPRVSDHFVDDNGQFLVMEYIDGEDLTEMLEKRGSAFPLTDVLNWTNQLLDGLDYLHEQGIVHRDIKPQNLKLNARGQIILLDFGLAKGNPTDAHNTTATKSVFGYSRNYASLEQIQGTGTDPRSDLYALGATLYHLVTGVPPEDALTRAMDVLNNKPDPLKPPHKVHAQVSENLSAILLRTMDLNASQRPHSAKEMREMLKSNDFANSSAQNFVAEQSNASSLYTQNTQIKQDTGVIKSDTETDTLVKTKIFDEKLNLQTSANSKQQVFANQTQPKRSGVLAGLAIGGLLLFSGAGAAVYLVSGSKQKAETPKASVSNTIANNESKAAASAENPSIAETPTTNSAADVIVKKELPAKPEVQSPTISKNPLKPENPQKTSAPVVPAEPVPPKTSTKKSIVVDSDGTKIYSDGSMETDDGTKITADGTIRTKDGTTIKTSKRIPPSTLEKLRKMGRLTPEQIKKLKEAKQNQTDEESDPDDTDNN
jgi:serine/threonine protein kinase